MIHIEIYKKKRMLDVVRDGETVRSFSVALGFSPNGDKAVEGDGRTPEGTFYVFAKNPKSKFHLSLGISYPSTEHAERGLSENLISGDEASEIKTAIIEKKMPPQKTALGGEIYIHGGGIEKDWTDGCVALKNKEIAELFDLIPKGAEVRIFP